MIAAQIEFMPTMLQGPGYNCSAVMSVGQAWADRFGKKQIPFGIYSLVFGVITEILYIPCMIGLGRDLRCSCIKIMFWLSFVDIIAILANCFAFGFLLLEGAVYCSNPVLTLGAGIVGYGFWCTSSACCLVLAINRLCAVLDLSKYFTNSRTNLYIGMCGVYGLFMTLFTRPLIINSARQSMFFSPFIPGHSVEEYVNWPHAVQNICVTVILFILYSVMCTVLFVRSRPMASNSSHKRIIKNIPIFVQSMLISCVNLLAACIYVFMNFVPVPPSLTILGHVCWQIDHGSPPFIYLALNKSIRRLALESVGLRRLLRNNRGVQFTTTQVMPMDRYPRS